MFGKTQVSGFGSQLESDLGVCLNIYIYMVPSPPFQGSRTGRKDLSTPRGGGTMYIYIYIYVQ